MFSPKNVDGSFHTNTKFTKLYFKLRTDKTWFEFDNIFSREVYIKTAKSSFVMSQTEILQILVEDTVREIGIFGQYVCITFHCDGHKIIPIKRHDKFPDDATLVPSFAINTKDSNECDVVANVEIVSDKCVDDNVPDTTQAPVNKFTVVIVEPSVKPTEEPLVKPTKELTEGLRLGGLEMGEFLTRKVITQSDISAVCESTPCKECTNKKENKKEIPYDIIIDLRLSCLPNDSVMIKKTNALLEYYDLTDVLLLKNLLSREPSKENDYNIKKIFDIRTIIRFDTRGTLPIAEFERYRKGYLFELFTKEMPKFNQLSFDMEENSALFDLVRVIKETEVHCDDVHRMIDDFVKNGVYHNKAGVLQVLMKALI
jgi:hypothetical protein